MSEKTRKRRAELRIKLIDAAEAAVLNGGIAAVKARDLAGQVGCALGAIYTVFDDISELVLAVNSRTYHRLGQAVSNSVSGLGGADPAKRLTAMAHAYLKFAAENPTTWRALFDVPMPEDSNLPDWYLEETFALLSLISAPVAELRPDLPRDDIKTLTSALFSSVHGIVLLGIEKRISSGEIGELQRMIEEIINNFAFASRHR